MTLRLTPLRRALTAALLAGGLLGGVPMSAWAHALPAAPAPSTHEQALATILVESRVLPIGRAAIQASGAPEYRRKLLEHFWRTHSDEEIAAAYARQLGPTVSPTDSAAALKVAKLAPMRAMMKDLEALAAKGATSLAPEPVVKKYGAAIEKLATPAQLQAYQRFGKAIQGLGGFAGTMVEAHDKALGEQFTQLMVAMMRLAERDDFTVAEIPRARTGFALTDNMLDIFDESLQRSVALNEGTTAANSKVPLDTLLESENLVSAAAIERGRATVAQAEQISRDHMVQFQQIYSERADRIRTALKALPNYSDANLDARASQAMEFILSLSETRQRHFAVLRRMLDFAHARVGQTALKDGTLLFATDADVETWGAMVKELERLENQDTETIAKGAERERKLIDGLDKKR